MDSLCFRTQHEEIDPTHTHKTHTLFVCFSRVKKKQQNCRQQTSTVELLTLVCVSVRYEAFKERREVEKEKAPA